MRACLPAASTPLSARRICHERGWPACRRFVRYYRNRVFRALFHALPKIGSCEIDLSLPGHQHGCHPGGGNRRVCGHTRADTGDGVSPRQRGDTAVSGPIAGPWGHSLAATPLNLDTRIVPEATDHGIGRRAVVLRSIPSGGEEGKTRAMPIPELRAPLAFAGDKPGPFAGNAGRDLRVLVDLPASQRQADDSTHLSRTGWGFPSLPGCCGASGSATTLPFTGWPTRARATSPEPSAWTSQTAVRTI